MGIYLISYLIKLTCEPSLAGGGVCMALISTLLSSIILVLSLCLMVSKVRKLGLVARANFVTVVVGFCDKSVKSILSDGLPTPLVGLLVRTLFDVWWLLDALLLSMMFEFLNWDGILMVTVPISTSFSSNLS